MHIVKIKREIDRFRLPLELNNDLLAYLIQEYVVYFRSIHKPRKLITKENISMILSGKSVETLSFDKYQSLKADALKMIPICASLTGTHFQCCKISNQA